MSKYSPFKFNIYTDIEAAYKQSLLKKRANTYDNVDILKEFHDISEKTVEVLTHNMIS